MDDKYSIKNLVFLHATSNYVIPVETEGHKVFFCVDCGDKFVCESSYNFHVNRRSVKITYTCRICYKTMVYMNRCNLLSHIRSHVFKTATINLVDLKIEPLPKEDMVFGLFHLDQPLTMEEVLSNEINLRSQNESHQDTSITSSTNQSCNVDHEETVVCQEPSKEKLSSDKRRTSRKIKCFDCNMSLSVKGTSAETRRNHYMSASDVQYTCRVCTYKLPTMCAMNAHIRMHQSHGINVFCPECGSFNRNSHSCGGFKAIQMTVNFLCPVEACGLVPKVNFTEHFKQEHIKSVYKCSTCISACFSGAAMKTHVASKHPERAGLPMDVMLYYQCLCCPGRLVIKKCLGSHILSHKSSLAPWFPCHKCGNVCGTISDLLGHTESCEGSNVVAVSTATKENSNQVNESKNTSDEFLDCHDRIKCPKCDLKLNSTWNCIKKHFYLHHKKYKCLDIKVQIKKLKLANAPVATNIRMYAKNEPQCSRNLKATAKRRRNKTAGHDNSKEKFKDMDENTQQKKENEYTCLKCGDTKSTSPQSFKDHILTHRDPSMAYQCMECGLSFVVKPSFSTHLFVAHAIKDAEKYIKTKKCYNEDAFKIIDNGFASISENPLKENQCKICREQFDSEDDLGKHFRVHGMAFIMTKKHKQ